MSKRTLFTALVLGAVAGGPARAQNLTTPVHGCTFWNPRLAAASASCAEWTSNWGGCTITHCSPIGCISYPGNQFYGYMPDSLIEVTNRAGQSAFATVDAPGIVAQMLAAKTTWSANGDVTGLRTSQDRPDSGAEYSMWFGRTLPVAYGFTGWQLESAGWRGGWPAAVCMNAITEFAPETWADRPSSGDRSLAAMWSPVSTPACMAGAPIFGVPFVYDWWSVRLQAWWNQGKIPTCAIPLTTAWQQLAPWANTDAFDPTRVCMGALGPKLPRTGWTDGDPWTAAQRVAWRTASMADVYFQHGVGDLPVGSKWQIVYPRVPVPNCFTPGSLGRPSTSDPTSALLRGPNYDTPDKPSEFIFAVWNRRERCLEPWEGAGIAAEMLAYPVRIVGVCGALNAAMPELLP